SMAGRRWTIFFYAPCGSLRNSRATSIWARTREWKMPGKVGYQRFMYSRPPRLTDFEREVRIVGAFAACSVRAKQSESRQAAASVSAYREHLSRGFWCC